MPSPQFAALFAGLLLLAGCAAAPPRQALNPELRTQVSSADVRLALPQPAIFVQLAAQEKNPDQAQAAAAPLRKALGSYGFDGRLKAALDQNLSRATRLKANPAKLLKDASAASYQQQLVESSASAVLLLTASYSLTPDFSSLEIGLRAELMPRSAALRNAAGLKSKPAKELKLDEALYRNTIVFRSRLPEAGVDPLANRELWLADKAYPLQQALEDGITEVVAALGEDLQTKPGLTRIGPALTDGYQRQRNADGTLRIAGLASSGRSVQVEVAAPALRLAAPTEIAPPEPLPEPELVDPAAMEMVEPGLFVPVDAATGAAPAAAPGTPAASTAPMTVTPPQLSLAPALSASPPAAVRPAPTPAEPAPAAVVAAPAAPAVGAVGRTRVVTPMRQRPTPISALFATLPAGAGVQVRGRTNNTSGEWLYVQSNADSGWVRAAEVELNP